MIADRLILTSSMLCVRKRQGTLAEPIQEPYQNTQSNSVINVNDSSGTSSLEYLAGQSQSMMALGDERLL
jgi:hypothetical protein